MSNPATYLQMLSTVTEDAQLRMELVEKPFPTPEAHEVVIRVEATPINPSDQGVMFGWSNMANAAHSGEGVNTVLTAPVTPQGMAVMKARIGQNLPVGNEGAGTVVAAGDSDEAQALMGKIVSATSGTMYGQYACVPVMSCLPLLPEHSAKDGASSFVNPMTALSMVEVMQQEIAELRGTVEEQNHTIEMLKKQQQERYLDLDRRMSELMKAPAQPKAVSNSGASVGVLPADDLYASAMAAIKQKDFASALTQLDTFAKHYPQHALAANAFYWSGEVQLAEGNFEAAIKQFVFVVKNHPKHNKAPDSHYKLAVAYDRNGNTAKAKEVLKQVATQYKGVSDSVVRLAERYLERLKGG